MSDAVLVVGLGSNINPHFHLRQALKEFKTFPGVQVLNVARIYESDPELPEQLSPDAAQSWNHSYLNSAILLKVKNFEANSFLKDLKALEIKIGRRTSKDSQRWAPREIDLDILFAEGIKLQNSNLQIPHKRLMHRPFALLPLFDVFPEEKLFSQLARMDLISEVPLWVRQKWRSDTPFNTRVSKEFFWTEFVGILNLTKDSFSDGSKNDSEEEFKINARKHLESGAGILDLGAESTRPVTEPRLHDVKQELHSLVSALRWLQDLRSEFPNFKISVDTRHSFVAGEVLKNFTVNYLNDVSGFRDSQMLELACVHQTKLIVMHSLSVPVNKNEIIDENVSPIETLNQWWSLKLIQLTNAGIAKDRIIFDPGIGFGKSAAQNHFILNNIEKIETGGCDVLIGHSRKSFLQSLSAKQAKDRDPETALITKSMNKAFYNYLRVHDVLSNQSSLVQ